ncbi:MAG: DMT family transporter [Thermoplasmatota archaeon]
MAGGPPVGASRRYIVDRMTVAAVICMVLFGTSFWGLVIALKGIPPVTLGFLRALLVFCFMISLLIFLDRVMGRKGMLRKDNIVRAGLKGRKGLLMAVSLAVFSTVLPNIFQNVGMTMMDPGSTSSLTALIQGVSPVFTILFAVPVLHEKLGVWKLTGLLIAVPATAVLTTYGSGGLDLGSRETIGAFLNLVTAFSYSISGLILKSAMNRGGRPVHLVLVNSMYGTLILLPICLVIWFAGWEDPFRLIGSGGHVWLALIYTSIGLYGITAVLWYRVIRSGDLSRVTFFVFLLPVFSYIVGFILLNERLGAVQMLAGAALLVGVGLSQMGRKKVLTLEQN